jgi:phospholipid/cholesterol/gamma-HCH transport system substrate-binding protein
VTSKIDSGQGTIGRLVNDDGLVRRLEGLVDGVNDFTSRYARLQVEVDFRSEYLFGQSSMKHYVSMRLRPRPDKYYFFQVVDDPRGKVSVGQRVTTSNDPNLPPVLAEEIVETSSGLKFTAQFAKRWHFLTFRYGIMESTGGWGIDLDLLEDALRFKLDIFDFSFQSLPRVRLLAAWEFVRHVYISAGIDDMLNADERDYFFGVGATFTDADLKSALPLLPTGL